MVHDQPDPTTLPGWMTGCAVCVRMVAEFDAMLGLDGVVPQADLAVWLRHAVQAHLAQLPEYRADCSGCRDWRALSVVPQEQDRDGSMARTLTALDLQHRAKHVLVGRWGSVEY